MALRWRIALFVVAGAIAASAFSTILAHQVVRAAGRDPITWRLVLLNTTFWFGWVILALPLIELARRVRIDRRPSVAVPVHLIAIALAAVAHVALQTTSEIWSSWRLASLDKPETVAAFDWVAAWLELFPFTLTRLIDWELLGGAAVVGIAHASFYYADGQKGSLREAQLETKLVEAQLRMLQHQLHPHFLFNTLHAISALMHRDVRAADRVLVRLSDLLRITLDSVSRPEIRLNEELEFIRKYLEIEQVRLGDRLTVSWKVQPDTLDAAVPALLLQPLVENAIKHGIAPMTVPGQVTISAVRDADKLVLTVSDTGPGPAGTLRPSLATGTTGIGLANTRARLHHQFGDHYRFDFRTTPEGFTVLVAIPFRLEPARPAPAFVA